MQIGKEPARHLTLPAGSDNKKTLSVLCGCLYVDLFKIKAEILLPQCEYVSRWKNVLFDCFKDDCVCFLVPDDFEVV